MTEHDSYRGYEEEGNPWDELMGPGAPVEPSADERKAADAEKRSVHIDAAEVYTEEAQAFLFLVGALVHRVGGAIAFTRDERREQYVLAIDQSGLHPGGDGVLRLFSTKAGDDS